jgi:hypothetical protein
MEALMDSVAASLHPSHLQDLRKSTISDSTIQRSHIHDVRPDDLRKLGPKYAQVTSALRFPYFTLDGTINGFSRDKLFPALEGQKYHQPKGTDPDLYLPPLADWPHVATDASVPVLIVEGEKKTLALLQRDIIAVGVAGVWNWRAKLDSGETLVLPKLDCFCLKGRRVEFLPDSDAWRPDKLEAVLSGFYALGMELLSRGAHIAFIQLRDANGAKVGADDWLAQVGDQWGYLWPKLERLSLDHRKLKGIAR